MLSSNVGRNLRLRIAPRIQLSRNIVVVKKKRRTKKDENGSLVDESPLLSWARDDTSRRMKLQEAEYRKKLQEIKNLTRSVADMINEGERLKELEMKLKELEDAVKNIPMPSEFARSQIDKVYQELGGSTESASTSNSKSSISDSTEIAASRLSSFSPSSTSHLIIPSSLTIPQPIVEKLGLSVKYLISEKNQNWPMVLHQLEEAGGFDGVSSSDVRTFIKSIPKLSLNRDLIHSIEKMMDKASIPKTSKFVDLFIEGLSYGGSVSNETMKEIESYMDYLKGISKNKKGKLPRSTYELVIKALGKNNNLAKINELLSDMKLANLSPSKETFSNVLTCCVYKAKDHKQAVEIFDSMKFMSVKTKPTTRNYQDIIVSYINNDNIEKALDLYQEMLQTHVDVNQKILVALARGCTHRPELKLKSWEFMFEIYNLGWEPALETFEMILLLAANDGDVALSRALYFKLNETKSITARAFSYLMLSYSKFRESLELPTITFNEKGQLFRKRLLNDVQLDTSTSINPQFRIPFLPIVELTRSSEVLAESSAFWAHTLMFNQWMINDSNTDIYLKIALEHGKLEDFINRFENATGLDESGIPQTREIIVEDPEVAVEEPNEGVPVSETDSAEITVADTNMTSSPLLNSLIESKNIIKIPRSTKLYITALSAAGKFQSYDFGQQIWNERGLFRKSTRFTSLERKVKDLEDFQFAASMVSALTKMGMLSDALAIVMSTEYQFRWSRNELAELYHTASEIGDENIVQTVNGISSRSLIKWEGKIRRKDYKKYVMQRGY